MTSRQTLETANVQSATNVWSILHSLGENQLRSLQTELEIMARVPGEVVMVQAQQMRGPSESIDSLLLSGIDVRTHLQTARMYFFSSLAATIDFVEFLTTSFPFPVQEIATLGHDHLGTEQGQRMEHRFALAAHRCGVRHWPADSGRPGILIYLERYCHAARIGPDGDERAEELSAELQRYLFYHNNQRSLPTLNGRTPLEELRRFPRFRNVRTFDPFS